MVPLFTNEKQNAWVDLIPRPTAYAKFHENPSSHELNYKHGDTIVLFFRSTDIKGTKIKTYIISSEWMTNLLTFRRDVFSIHMRNEYHKKILKNLWKCLGTFPDKI